MLRHDSDMSCFCSLKPKYNEDCDVDRPQEPLVEVALSFFTMDDDDELPEGPDSDKPFVDRLPVKSASGLTETDLGQF